MLKKAVCVLAILGMVGVASAAQHWRGAGWNGDGHSWSDVLNWDDRIPSDDPITSWDVNVTGEQGTPGNHTIDVDVSGATTTATIGNQAGYTVALTVKSGVTFTTTDVAFPSAGSITVESTADYDMRYGQLAIESSGLLVTVDDNARLYCSTLRHNNGTKVDVYGELRAYTVSRISNDPGYRLAVYNDGLFRVDSGVPATAGWSKGGKVTQYICSTVLLRGDHTGHYLDLVQAGEPGTWDVGVVTVDGFAYTSIHLAPEPTTALFLLCGLPLFRRRRA